MQALRETAATPVLGASVVTVFVPEYVVAHWWQNLLHDQSALRLRARLARNRASWW